MYILGVEPNYYTKYPPLGLLKILAYHRNRGDCVQLVSGSQMVSYYPDKIYITSLFTYAWQVVHDTVAFYRKWYPNSEIHLGGIYASLMPEHAETTGAIIHRGVWDEVENVIPAWDLVPEWKSSIVFSSRGCIRNCSFCGVNICEPVFIAKSSIKELIYAGHNKIVLWDNNILASPYWDNIADELIEAGKAVDFNQGLDSRKLTLDVAHKLKMMHLRDVRLAYDQTINRSYLESAIENLINAGFKGKRIFVYVLYNYQDSPNDFLKRIQDLMNWGVVTYPMRYEPITSLCKGSYIEPGWTSKELEMIAQARRVIGYLGSWPPTEGLKWKFGSSKSFEEAFSLRDVCKSKK